MLRGGAMEWLFLLSSLLPLAAGATPAVATSIRNRYWSPTSPAGAPRVTIGAPTTLLPSGRRYKLSTEMRYAYHMFLTDYFHRQGGVLVNGTRLGLDAYYIDDASSSAQAEWSTQELVDELGLKLFLAGYSNGLTRGVAKVVNATGGAQVASGASFTDIYRGRDTIFGTLPATAGYEASAVELMGLSDGGVRKTLWFVAEAFDQRDLSPLCARNNVDLLQVSRFPSTNWRPVLEQAVQDIIRADPDVVLLRTARDMCHAFVRRLWQLQYSPKALILVTCPAGPEFIQAVGFAGQYVLHVTPWLPTFSLSGPLTGSWTASSFTSQYEQDFGVSPSYQVASAFIGVAALVYAIETANSLDPQAVAAVLRNMNVGSIFGNVSFDANGQSNLRMKVTQYQMTESPKLIFPCDVCEGSLFYPRPNRSLMDCLSTDPGHVTRFGWMQGRCVECPLGRAPAVLGSGAQRQRVCAPCGPGQSGRDTGATLLCEACQPGTSSGAEAAAVCDPCPLGSHANASGLTACTACAAGRLADAPGMSECATCAAGSYQNATGQSLCRRCEEGRYSPQKGATGCRACPPSLSTQGSGFSRASDCSCPAGTLDPSVWDATRPQRCEACAEGLHCPGFGAPPGLAPGYHEAAAAFSPLRSTWLCIDAAACPGGAPGSCSGEREGLACSLCPVGRARGADYRCPECSGGNLLLPALGTVALVLALVPVYYLANGMVVQRTSVKLGTGITVGIAITVVQILGMFNRLNIPWAPQVRGVLETSSWAALGTESLALECMLGREPAAQYLFTALAPFAVAALFALLALASRLLPGLSGGKLAAWTFVRSFNALLSLGQAVFIAITSMAALSVQCYSHPNGKLSMMKYPSVICFEGDHITILAMGVLMLLFLVIPFVVVCAWGSYSVHYNTQVKGPIVKHVAMYRFLIFRFQPAVWWWGNAFNARQLFLGIAPMVMPDDPGIQLYFVIFVLILYLIGTVWYFPWRVIEINILDLLTVTCLILALAVGTSLLPPTAWRGRHEAILATIIFFVIAVVAASLLYCLLLLATRGAFQRFGLDFPPEGKMDAFITTWMRLLKKVSKLNPKEQREVIAEMDAFERLAMDRVMCIMEASFDVKARHSRARATTLALEGGGWQPRTKMLRLCATEARLCATRHASEREEEHEVNEGASIGWMATNLSSERGEEGQPQPAGGGAPIEHSVRRFAV